MDGTLLDSNRHLDTITERFFKKRNVPYAKAFLVETKTMSKATYCTAVKKMTLDPRTFEEIAAEVDEYLMDIYKNDVQLMPDAATLLKKYSANGIKMCIASATDKDTVTMVLKRLAVLKHFEFVISCETVGKDKDQPDIFLEAAKQLGAGSPSEVTVYEDSSTAMRTARNAGFHVIGIQDPEESSKEDLSEICDLLITGFAEL